MIVLWEGVMVDIMVLPNGEVQYVFQDKLTDHQADIAAFIMDTFRENVNDRNAIISLLMDELDVTIGEALEIMDEWKMGEFEDRIIENFD